MRKKMKAVLILAFLALFGMVVNVHAGGYQPPFDVVVWLTDHQPISIGQTNTMQVKCQKINNPVGQQQICGHFHISDYPLNGYLYQRVINAQVGSNTFYSIIQEPITFIRWIAYQPAGGSWTAYQQLQPAP